MAEKQGHLADKQSWFRRHARWLILVLVGYALTLTVTWLMGRAADWMNVTTAYFVAANLIVLWWYADTTRLLLETSRRQIEIGQAQYDQLIRQSRISHKPFVIVERVQRDDSNAFRYFIRNVGPGLAVNTWIVQENTDGSPRLQSLGSLAPNGSRLLSDIVERDLCDNDGVFPFAIFAEGIASRTAQWTATANVRERHRGGEMRNQPLAVRLTGKTRTIEQLLNQAWDEIRNALRNCTAGM